MKRYLLIDDTKRWEDVLNITKMFGETLESEHPDIEFHIAKTFSQGLDELRAGNWDMVYLDWDLGQGESKTGLVILDWLSRNTAYLPKAMFPCTGHPGHKGDMWKKMEALYGR